MNIKEQWIDKFQDLLWGYHSCDWDAGNKNPNLAFQLAVAYFNWASDNTPEETVEHAFARYLETLNEYY